MEPVRCGLDSHGSGNTKHFRRFAKGKGEVVTSSRGCQSLFLPVERKVGYSGDVHREGETLYTEGGGGGQRQSSGIIPITKRERERQLPSHVCSQLRSVCSSSSDPLWSLRAPAALRTTREEREREGYGRRRISKQRRSP